MLRTEGRDPEHGEQGCPRQHVPGDASQPEPALYLAAAMQPVARPAQGS